MRTAVCVLVVVLLSAGCGGGTKPDYDTRMQAVLPPVASQLLKLRLQLERVRTPQQAGTLVRRLRRTVERTQGQLEEISPPADVEAAHGRLVGAFGDLDRALVPLARSAESVDLSAFLAEAQRFGRSRVFARLGAAIDEIEARGHDLGLSTSSG